VANQEIRRLMASPKAAIREPINPTMRPDNHQNPGMAGGNTLLAMIIQSLYKPFV
jgi:hypothetical protein